MCDLAETWDSTTAFGVAVVQTFRSAVPAASGTEAPGRALGAQGSSPAIRCWQIVAGALSVSPAPRVLVIADIRRALRVEGREFLLNPGGPFSLLPAGWTIRRGRVERVDVVLQARGDV